MDQTERALNPMLDSMNDLASAAKLQFSLSTGAIVLFVHETSQFHRMPVRTGILSIASVFFGFSAIQCIRALIHMSKFKIAIGDTIWRDVERRGDLLRERAKADIEGMEKSFGKTDRFFYAGVTWSVIFVIVQFACSFR